MAQEMMASPIYYYVIAAFGLYAVLIAVLEYVRRRSIDDIKAKSYNAFLSFYEMKIYDFCRDKDDECRSRLSDIVVCELSSQIEEGRIHYVDIEKLYSESTGHVSN